jgi:hypothetical protein
MILGILASAGGAAAVASYESIATATGTGSSGTITFSSIPSTFTHLQVRVNAIATAYSGTGGYVRFNSDTGSNYAYHYLVASGGAVTSGGAATQTEMQVLINNAVGLHNTSANAAIIDVLDYASTSKYKTLRNFEGVEINGSGDIAVTSGLWQSTSAINAVTVYLGSGSYATTTTIALYGIKAA